MGVDVTTDFNVEKAYNSDFDYNMTGYVKLNNQTQDKSDGGLDSACPYKRRGFC